MNDVTQLRQAATGGDRLAAAKLLPLVYDLSACEQWDRAVSKPTVFIYLFKRNG